jgi:Protein of unknown function (DUF2591)
MKISELTGAALDWAVDKAEGRIRPDGGYYCGHHGRVTRWSTDWAQGGPIIEREEIGVQCVPAGTSQGWWAIKDSTFHDRSRPDEMRGDTPLIAAMRCYVASKLGDDIDLPKELL